MPSSQRVEFKNSEGQSLSARIELPPNKKPIAFVVFAHCFTCGKNLSVARSISRALTSRGFGLMRFDFSGLGESEGEFADSNFSSNVDEIIDAVKYLTDHYESPKLLIGHSLGGTAVLKAAFQLDSIEAIATLGAPAQPKHVLRLLKDSVDDLNDSGETTVKIGPAEFKLKKQFLEDIRSNNLLDKLKHLKKPLLILHSPQDEIVGIENAAELYTHAWHPKSFISLDGSDHLISNPADAEYSGLVIAEWALRYLSLNQEENKENQEGVVASLSSDAGFSTEISSGKHGFIADEPLDIGGNDLGPTPYQLLSSSLAACTAMTIKMYSERKKWPLEHVEVKVLHSKKHGEDCIHCEEKKAKVDHLDRYITVEGDLDDSQKDRLLEIANKCPVHKTLSSEMRISTQFGDQD